MPNIPVAAVPGHTGVQSKEELKRNILDVTLDDVVRNLTGEVGHAMEQSEPGARDPTTMRIQPRRSFEVWRQTVRGCSAPWQPWSAQ